MSPREMRDGLRRSHLRLQEMVDQALAKEPLGPEATDRLLQELSAALEELRVAEEELTVQGEQLAASTEAIDAERQRYAELFDFAPDAYLATDELGKVVEANQAASELLGVPLRMLSGRLLVGFVDPEERRVFRRLLQDVVDGIPRDETTLSMLTRDGRSFVGGLTVARRVAPEVDHHQLRWLVRDITLRVKLEEEVELLSDEVEMLSQLSTVQRLVEGPDPLAESLQAIVELGHRSLPGCEVGISLIGREEIERQVGSGPRAQELDELQRQAGAGPCIEALTGRSVVRGRPSEWPVLADADGDVREVLGIPLLSGSEVTGALNVYALSTDLDDHAVRLLTLLAQQAATALDNARLFSSSAGLAAGLAQALENRGTIERAKGILMAQQGCDADTAFDLLRRASQRENVKLHRVAARIAADPAPLRPADD